MDSSKISVKGFDNKLLFKLPESDWQVIKAGLSEYLMKNGDFLKGGKIILDSGKNVFRSFEMVEMKGLFLDYQMTISQLVSEIQETREAGALLGISSSRQVKPVEFIEKETDTSIRGEMGVVITRTLRSGNTAQSDGHITIIGDVNPGGCVKAKGNIIIWGKLRGEAHAGINNNQSSSIMALEMSPSNLTIAGISLIDKKRKTTKIPEQATMINGEIKISPWKEK